MIDLLPALGASVTGSTFVWPNGDAHSVSFCPIGTMTPADDDIARLSRELALVCASAAAPPQRVLP
jgi:hypothetical protein